MKSRRKKHFAFLLTALMILNIAVLATKALAAKPIRNKPPVADAGSDQTVIDVDNSGNEEVTLDGSGSSDPDGTIFSYVWEENAIQIATGINPTVTLAVGTYTITLIVTDDKGDTGSDTVTITLRQSQVPRKIRFQGIIKDKQTGSNLDGLYNLTFNIYDVETGGISLWTESQQLQITNGILDIVLGNLDLPFDKPYYLGITVDPDTYEMTPRFEMTTVPYAFSSER